jgi:hypothetical protein
MTSRYRLRVTPLQGFGSSGGGCGDTTSVLVQVAARPAAPTLGQQGATLTSSSTTGSQWYLNGVAIAGATGATHLPTTSGNYSVAAVVGTGSVVCSSTPSAPRAVTVTAARQALAGSSLRVLPNPTPDGQVVVQLTGYSRATTLELFDLTGRLVHAATIAAPSAQGTAYPLNLATLASGVYALRVSTAGGVDVCRLVRQ